MSFYRREEDEADKWLREHDPYYTDKSRSKRDKLLRPYDTPEQEHRRSGIEIPLSNLNSSQLVQIRPIYGFFDENGNFEL